MLITRSVIDFGRLHSQSCMSNTDLRQVLKALVPPSTNPPTLIQPYLYKQPEWEIRNHWCSLHPHTATGSQNPLIYTHKGSLPASIHEEPITSIRAARLIDKRSISIHTPTILFLNYNDSTTSITFFDKYDHSENSDLRWCCCWPS